MGELPVRKIIHLLGFEESDGRWLTQAFTYGPGPEMGNLHLAYVGDAAIEVVLRSWFVRHFPERHGLFDVWRSRLASNEEFADIVEGLGLTRFLRYVRVRPGGRRSDQIRIKGTLYEALCGGLWQHRGDDHSAVRRFIEETHLPRAKRLVEGAWNRHPRIRLRDACQRHFRERPLYDIITRPIGHRGQFEVAVRIGGSLELGRGRGESLADAKDDAASHAVEQIASGRLPAARLGRRWQMRVVASR